MNLRTTFFLAHAAADHEFALELAQFLEAGCDVVCYADEGMVSVGGAEDWLVPCGRTSTLITEDAVRATATPESFEYARELILAQRNAEAYELLRRLLEAETAPEACARELTWICQQWGRVEEANTLRFHFGPEPTAQLTLF